MSRLSWKDFSLPPINLWSVWKLAPKKSGCVYKCRLDEGRHLCVGCHRTIEEINAASNASGLLGEKDE
jgi:hypothetical protein